MISFWVFMGIYVALDLGHLHKLIVDKLIRYQQTILSELLDLVGQFSASRYQTTLLLYLISKVISNSHVGELVTVNHLGTLCTLSTARCSGDKQYLALELAVFLESVIHFN